MIAHSGQMMGCAIFGIVLSVSVKKASFQSRLRNPPVCFLLMMWFVRRENHKLLWIGLLMTKFLMGGLRLTIPGLMMMRLIIVPSSSDLLLDSFCFSVAFLPNCIWFCKLEIYRCISFSCSCNDICQSPTEPGEVHWLCGSISSKDMGCCLPGKLPTMLVILVLYFLLIRTFVILSCCF